MEILSEKQILSEIQKAEAYGTEDSVVYPRKKKQ